MKDNNDYSGEEQSPIIVQSPHLTFKQKYSLGNKNDF
jgi:hypothetical protein